MKAMTIGINPEYNYPGTLEKWFVNNTHYASNLGASMITRAIMKQFNADYVDDFSDIASLRNKYDTCIMALAAHTSEKRDISYYTNIVEKLDMKIVVLSLGMADYVDSNNKVFKIDKSLLRLLEISSSSNNWIGVRGLNTASVLQQNGIKNVLPIGCPTVYMNLKRDFDLNVKEIYSKPALSYHMSIGNVNPKLFEEIDFLIAQDYEDEIIFTKNLKDDFSLRKYVNNLYNKVLYTEEILSLVKAKGIFPKNYDEWFSSFRNSDIVIGPRLHGCIAAMNNGVPAIFTPRDTRVKEMVDFYNFASVDYDKLNTMNSLDEVYKSVNFDRFIETYRTRFDNYCSFLRENNLPSNLECNTIIDYTFLKQDISGMNYINSIQVRNLKEQSLQHKIRLLEDSIKENKKKIKKYIKKIIK